jgi:hypothetical protein
VVLLASFPAAVVLLAATLPSVAVAMLPSAAVSMS